MVPIGSHLLRWVDLVKICSSLRPFVEGKQDAICVTRRSLLLRSIVHFAVLVVLEGGQERDWVFVELVDQVVSVFIHEQLVRVDERLDVVGCSVLFRLVARQVASEIHIAKDELIVLLRPFE